MFNVFLIFARTGVWVYFIILLLILSSVVYYYSTSTFGKWKKANVPYVRPVPLFGNYLKIALCIDHPGNTYGKIYRELSGHKYGGMFQMRTPYLMIRDPALVNTILIKDFSYFPNRGIYSDVEKEPLTNHLFFMENPKWKQIRTKLSPAFTSGKLKVMFDQIMECGEEMMKNLCEQIDNTSDIVDVRSVLANYSMDVIGTCAFGLKLNVINDDKSPFRKYGKSLFHASPWYLLRELCLMISPALLRAFNLTLFPPAASEFFHSIFRDTIMNREKNNIIRNDYVHTLMQARKELVLNENLSPEERFSESQIVANAFVMFAAGFETISTSTSFCLYELSLKKHIQDKVRDEITLKMSKFNGVVNSDFLSELNYLDMVIAETLRKYPVVFGIFREAAQKYQVPNDSLVIEKGQKIVIPIMSLHNDPKYYSDPEVFNPERFSPEEKAKRPAGVYFPFGDGPRICIGKRFAEIEMKLALVKLLSKFEVEPCEKTEIPVTFSNMSMVAIPNDGTIWLKLNQLSN